jgi:hypothetical protein
MILNTFLKKNLKYGLYKDFYRGFPVMIVESIDLKKRNNPFYIKITIYYDSNDEDIKTKFIVSKEDTCDKFYWSNVFCNENIVTVGPCKSWNDILDHLETHIESTLIHHYPDLLWEAIKEY